MFKNKNIIKILIIFSFNAVTNNNCFSLCDGILDTFKREEESFICDKKEDLKKEEVFSSWPDIQKKYKDAVVQVFSCFKEFNWLEPYKGPNQNSGYGTAFFINDKGYLLTNYHVVAQTKYCQSEEHITIQIPSLGKERFDVEIVGYSPSKDIAVLKLKEESYKDLKENLKDVLGYSQIPYLPLGDSDSISGAQDVMVLGYPLGMENLKSSIGNVAGNQNIDNMNLIQTTAPVNFGNSGGPFFDFSGKVIGIDVAAIPDAQNIGYFIPISEVKNLIEVLVEHKYDFKVFKDIFWGIQVQSMTEDTLKFLGVFE